MGPLPQEQSTLHQELGRLEDVIAMLETKLVNQAGSVAGNLEKTPESVHVLDNVRNRVIGASLRLERLFAAVQTL